MRTVLDNQNLVTKWSLYPEEEWLRRSVWTRKFIALSSTKEIKTHLQDGNATFSYTYAIEKDQKKSSISRGLALWYQELIEDVQDIRDDADISWALKRLENLAERALYSQPNSLLNLLFAGRCDFGIGSKVIQMMLLRCYSDHKRFINNNKTQITENEEHANRTLSGQISDKYNGVDGQIHIWTDKECTAWSMGIKHTVSKHAVDFRTI
ncbi:unnamed protein product [Dibothriocephalus latus]|uniref:Uncharacterized protein n=1 Tax=Dibothriocephalus latus TaxID=60516 RepID=A0A3P7P6M2_DIBLA|nr:unnamed protein product [Dibothriocephalus latus]